MQSHFLRTFYVHVVLVATLFLLQPTTYRCQRFGHAGRRWAGASKPQHPNQKVAHQQMVEAVLRDKDPEWYQAQNGGYSESTHTTRRVRSGKEAVIAGRARTRRGDSGRQDVHNSDRRGSRTLAPPQVDANIGAC